MSKPMQKELSIVEVTEAEAGLELFLDGHCTLCNSPLISQYHQISPETEVEESTFCEKCGVKVRQKLHTLH